VHLGDFRVDAAMASGVNLDDEIALAGISGKVGAADLDGCAVTAQDDRLFSGEVFNESLDKPGLGWHGHHVIPPVSQDIYNYSYCTHKFVNF
jgi:hypothetical protein